MEQNFLQKYFTTWNDSWKSNGMSEKDVENITKSHGNVAPTSSSSITRHKF